MSVDMSLQALRRKLKTAEAKLQKLKDSRPLEPVQKRRSDTGCLNYMNKLYEQITKVDSLSIMVADAETARNNRRNKNG